MNIDLNYFEDSAQLNTWSIPTRVRVIEKSDCIEFIYKETSMIVQTSYPPKPPEERVFKIIFNCKNGKWNKSERIYGKIIPFQDESYKFD